MVHYQHKYWSMIKSTPIHVCVDQQKLMPAKTQADRQKREIECNYMDALECFNFFIM